MSCSVLPRFEEPDDLFDPFVKATARVKKKKIPIIFKKNNFKIISKTHYDSFVV